MFQNIDWTLFIWVGVDACFMIGNTILGIAKANKLKEFKWATLLEGVGKYLLILVGTCFIFLGGLLIPDFVFNITGLDSGVTVNLLLIAIAIAIASKYLISCYENYKKLFGLTDDEVKEAKSSYDNGIGNDTTSVVEEG